MTSWLLDAGEEVDDVSVGAAVRTRSKCAPSLRMPSRRGSDPWRGVHLTAVPDSGDALVINTDPAQRATSQTMIEETVAPYRRAGGC
jgi:hypothetical protein